MLHFVIGRTVEFMAVFVVVVFLFLPHIPKITNYICRNNVDVFKRT